MRLPVSWLRDFVATDATPHAIADVLTSRGFTVDAVEPQRMPDKIVVGRIETLAPHPDADKLQVSTVDAGAAAGRLQIVTGARNVAVGDKVPIALVGSVVYTGAFGADGEPETKAINRAKLRGVESNGMMASANELLLPGEFEDGILIMDAEATVGAEFWPEVRFGDAVLDVDVPSNRADCLSVIGLAREAAAGLGARFAEPSWDENAGSAASPISVAIDDSAVCRRLVGQLFTGLKNGRAPLWMTLRLHAAGVRSLDFLVDVSNYVQLETGQPLHFYDASLVRGGRIAARSAREGERVVTLDGVERPLPAGTPVIADGERIVGIAGIFGGLDAGVKASTTDVFLESPNFVGPRIRRAAIALGLRTEGGTRHERSLPLELPELGRRRAAELLVRAGAKASAVVEAGEKPGVARTISFRPARANALLGTGYDARTMSAAITPIGFAVAERAGALGVTVPWWRPDVVEEVDVIEEVARSIGYDGIDERRSVAAPQAIDESLFDQERSLARACASLGYREIVSIALQGTRGINAWQRSGVGYWQDLATVDNPLSDDQRFLRPSLLPGLLAAAGRSWPRAGGQLRLFEVGHVFRALDAAGDASARTHDGMYADHGVIEWPSLCGLASFGSEDETGAIDRLLMRVKGDAEQLVSRSSAGALSTAPHARGYFHPLASADLVIGGETVAKFGRLHPRLANAYELPATTYAFMLYMEALPRVAAVKRFVPLPKFPGTRRDLAVVVGEDVAAGDLMGAVAGARLDAFERVAAFDEYVGPQVEAGRKSIAIAIWFRKPDATITDAEADASAAAAFAVLRDKFGAALRGPAA